MEGRKRKYVDTDEGFVKKTSDLNEELDMTKAELRQMIKDIFDERIKSIEDKIMTKEDVKDIVRKMLKKQYQTFWQKSEFYLDKL